MLQTLDTMNHSMSSTRYIVNYVGLYVCNVYMQHVRYMTKRLAAVGDRLIPWLDHKVKDRRILFYHLPVVDVLFAYLIT